VLQKRVIVCLDVRDGKTTKGVRFKGNVDIGDPVKMAREYYQAGVFRLRSGVALGRWMTCGRSSWQARRR